MDADTPRGRFPANIRGHSAPSGWVTTQQAAKALDVSPRTVRWHIERGNLDAKAEGQGVRRSWLVSIDSLQALRDARQSAAAVPGDYRAPDVATDTAAGPPGNAIRVLADRLVEEASKASELRVRLELSEKAESTLREELEDERNQREAAEREREELRYELRALREAAEASKTDAEGADGSEPRPPAQGTQEAAQRPQGGTLRGWRRRILGW
jgi:hypothetical protein